MTDDRDFKRLVRQRMAKTGESYTAARAHLRPPTASKAGGIEAFRKRVYTRAGMGGLRAHLEAHYGIEVSRQTELDVGVLRIDRRDGPAWVARVFPAARPIDVVLGDAEILRYLEQHDVPAERCAHADAVSTFEEQGVLVTELVPGVNGRPDQSEQLAYVLGDLLGRVHALPGGSGAIARPAGSWHHLSLRGGGRSSDVAALQPLLAEAADRLRADERADFDALCAELAAIDDCADLPHALIHPDPCGANAIVSADADPVLVDWTGAGRGPRLPSFAYVIAGCAQLRLVDAAVAGYRRHVQLDDSELARLDSALRVFPLILDLWCFVFQNMPLSEIAKSVATTRTRAEAIAQRARAAFAADLATLGDWEVESRAQVQIEGQGTLL